MGNYNIQETIDMSGTMVTKSSIIVKLDPDLTKDDMVKIAKEIIENEKMKNEYVLVLMSSDDEVISRDKHGWECMAQWKRLDSNFSISRTENKEMKKIDDIYFEFK